MPIFDQSYRAYSGSRTGRAARVATIAWAGIRPVLRRRAFIGLLLLSYVAFGGDFMRLYISDYSKLIGAPSTLGPTGIALAPDVSTAKYFMEFLLRQKFFLFLLITYVGAGLIAMDMASGALPLYLSRPVGRLDYVLGKFSSIAAVGLLVTAVPALMLWGLAFSKAVGSGQPPPLLAGLLTLPLSAVLLVGLGSILLAVSSLTRTWNGAGLTFAGLFFVTDLASNVVENVLRTPFAKLISLPELFSGPARLLYGLPAESGSELQSWAATGILAALVGLSWLILWIRIHPGTRP